MQSLFAFALTGGALAMLYFAHGDTKAVANAIVQASRKTHAHHMLGMLVAVAHASVIADVVTHLKPWHGIAALFMFVIWYASRSPAEELA